MLTNILPPQYRKAAYVAYALIGVVLGAIQVAYLNIAGQPVWLTVALAVYGFVGTAFGATAASNITAGRGLSDAERADLADLFDRRAAAAAAATENVKREVYEQPAPAKKAAAKKPAKKAAAKPPQG